VQCPDARAQASALPGEAVDVSTLVLLGAAGGLLRGLMDVYTKFADWQSARRIHRQLPAEQAEEAPPFRKFCDPVTDPIAAVLHSVMGAGAAVLLGTTGQISGAYAAIVVGMSAPMLLTQLGRIQSVSDAVLGGGQAADATQTDPQSLPLPQQPALSSLAGQVPSQNADGSPMASGSAGRSSRIGWNDLRLPDSDSPSPSAATLGFPRPGLPGPDFGPVEHRREAGAGESASGGAPRGPAGGPGRGSPGHSAPRLSEGPDFSEEGTA